MKANLDEDDEDEEDEDVYLGNRIGLAGNNFEEGKSKSGNKERLGLTTSTNMLFIKLNPVCD